MLRLLLGAVLAIASLGAIPSAGAQAVDPDREAQLRFEAGRVAYTAGHYEDALSDFRRAYELSPRYALLYNIAETYARLERKREELEALEHYVREAPPDAPNLQGVLARIEIIRSLLASQEADEVASEPTPTPPEADTLADPPAAAADTTAAVSSDPAPFVVLAIAAALAVGGAVLLGVAEADRSALEGARAPTRYVDVAAAAERVPILEGVGIAAIALGAAGCIGAAIWAAGSPGAPAARVEVGLGIATMTVVF